MTFQIFSNEKRSVPLHTGHSTQGATSSTATTDGRVLALVRRFWSLRGPHEWSVDTPMPSQIEMAQDFDYRIPVGQFKMTPLTAQTKPFSSHSKTGCHNRAAPACDRLSATDFELSRRP